MVLFVVGVVGIILLEILPLRLRIRGFFLAILPLLLPLLLIPLLPLRLVMDEHGGCGGTSYRNAGFILLLFV